MTAIEQRTIPPRGARGSNQSIIRTMRLATLKAENGRKAMVGDSVLMGSKKKANSFAESARKMGLRVVRRAEEGGVRCWIIERGKK